MMLVEPTVFIVEDDKAICEALRELFKSVQLAVEIYHTAKDYLNNYNPAWLGCLLTDVRLPAMSGLELLEQLKKLNNKLPVIIMTGYADVPMAVRAMRAGAFDFIMKPFNNQVLLEQVQHAIALGRAQHVSKADYQQDAKQRFDLLTAREREVLALLIEGKLNKEIAAALKIATTTVEFHRSHIMHKMQAKNFAGLIKKYMLLSHS